MTISSSGARAALLITDEIHWTGGVTVSYAAAADLVKAIDEPAMRCAPHVLSRRLVMLRSELVECCTRAIARVEASTEVVAARNVLALDPGVVIDATTAARMLNMTPDGVRWLCKNERLAGSKVNGRWWIDLASVDLYLRSKG